jgi:hypothetical protein
VTCGIGQRDTEGFPWLRIDEEIAAKFTSYQLPAPSFHSRTLESVGGGSGKVVGQHVGRAAAGGQPSIGAYVTEADAMPKAATGKFESVADTCDVESRAAERAEAEGARLPTRVRASAFSAASSAGRVGVKRQLLWTAAGPVSSRAAR